VDGDRTIACADCGSEFVFTAGEQEFYAQRGFTESPKRCSTCRARRKAQRQGDGYGSTADGGYGGAYAGGNGSGYGGSSAAAYTGYSGGYPGTAPHLRERPQREMFDAVCAECGGTARVPFRPSGARPVYCSSCFQTKR